MDLPLVPALRVGFLTQMTSADSARATATLAERLGYATVWVGDHVAFPLPTLDPLLQLAQVAAFAPRLALGTSVFLLPLRHPVHVAKQVATLDRLCAGRFVFGVGVGGEFPGEYAACEVPVAERGLRLDEAIPLLRAFWRAEAVEGRGRFYRFPPTRLSPPPVQPGGPGIWCGGRAPVALRRAGRIADGWIGYALTPERYRGGLETIATAASRARRKLEGFGIGHLLFVRLDSDRETALDVASAHLSARYAMDFRRPAERYAALGPPADVAERIEAFRSAGVRTLILDPAGPPEDRDTQLERFAREVRPLLGG